jgi:hypothetical protein
MTTAREPRLSHGHTPILRASDHQLALRTHQPQHVLSVDEGGRFKVFRSALAISRARVEHERRDAVWRPISSSIVFWIDGLQVPIRWREWAAQNTHPGTAPRRARKRILTRVTQGIAVSESVAPVAVVKTIMPCIGRLRAEQEKQAHKNRCSHERPTTSEAGC